MLSTARGRGHPVLMSSTSAALLTPARPRFSERIRAPTGRHPALAVAVATLVLAWAALLATHHSPHLAVPKQVALEHVLADPGARSMLAGVHWTRLAPAAIDGHHELLGFYRGPRLVATVDVAFDGHVLVLDRSDLARSSYAYGSDIANDVRVLLGLCAVFVIMTGVWPLWRIRNLDVAVAASSALSIAVFDDWTLERMVLVAYPALIYLALRCAWRALGPAPGDRAAVPLYELLTRRSSPSQQLRILRSLALACALIVAMVGLSSPHVIDVGYAVMEGATAIVHGLLPYAHVADVLHGDTYPIGSYLLYVPLAWLWPVHTVFDDADCTLAVAVCAALGAAWGLARPAAGGQLARSRRSERPERPGRSRPEQHAAEILGLRAAIAWLTFPPLLLTVSTGTTDVALAAALVGALLLWRKPGAGTALLSLAAWFKLVPVALFPLWIARLRRGALARALLAAAVVSLVMVAVLVALGGAHAATRMVGAMSFQMTRTAPDTLWAFVGSVPLQQLAEALTLALIAGAAVRLRRDQAFAADRRRFAALCAAVLLGIQISGNYWTFMYLTWVFPFIALSLLAGPNASEGHSGWSKWMPGR